MGRATAAGGRGDTVPTPTQPKAAQWPQTATTPSASPPGPKPAQAAAPTKAGRPGVGDGSCSDPDASSLADATHVADPAGQVAAALQAAAPAGFDVSALAQAFTAALAPEFAKLSSRIDSIERGSSRDGSARSGDSRDSDSSASAGGDAFFVGLTSQNPHWVAKHFKDDHDQQPRKQSLHTYAPWDTLNSKTSRHERGGALGASMQYMEPACAYLWEALTALHEVTEQLGRGDLADSISAISGTVDEVYNMLNEHRQLVVEQVRSIGSDDAFEKAQSKHLQRCFA